MSTDEQARSGLASPGRMAEVIGVIDDAGDEAALRAALQGATAAVVGEMRAGTPASTLAGAWSDALRHSVSAAVQIVSLAAEPQWTWFVSGSVGRGEAAPGSDVETMLAIGDHVDESGKAGMLSQAATVHELLERSGVGVDAHGVLASRPRFCRRLASWREGVERWTADPRQDRGVVMTGLMADSTGVLSIMGVPENALRTLAVVEVGRSRAARQAFLHDATAVRAHFPSRLSVLATQSDTVDLKLSAMDPLVKIARWAALAAGSDATSTLRRLDDATAAKILDAEDASSLRECFGWLMRFRWRVRMTSFTDGRRVTDAVALSELAPHDRAVLRSIAREVVGIGRKARFVASFPDTEPI